MHITITFTANLTWSPKSVLLQDSFCFKCCESTQEHDKMFSTQKIQNKICYIKSDQCSGIVIRKPVEKIDVRLMTGIFSPSPGEILRVAIERFNFLHSLLYTHFTQQIINHANSLSFQDNIQQTE